jgi:hypothetical protein
MKEDVALNPQEVGGLGSLAVMPRPQRLPYQVEQLWLWLVFLNGEFSVVK